MADKNKIPKYMQRQIDREIADLKAVYGDMGERKKKAALDADRKELAKMTNALSKRGGLLSVPDGAPPEVVDYVKRINQARQTSSVGEFDKINAIRVRLGMKPIDYNPAPAPMPANIQGPLQTDQIRSDKPVQPSKPTKPTDSKDYLKFAAQMGYIQPDSSFVAQMDSVANTVKPKVVTAGSKPAPKTTVKKSKKSFNQRSIERNRYKMKPRKPRKY